MDHNNRLANCPLCKSEAREPFHRDKRRDYYRCRSCGLTFILPEQYLHAHAEKAEYDLHRNDPHDAGYRRFLGRLFEPMVESLEPGSSGLDFGCGPGPALSVMFEEAGHEVALYDYFYAHDKSVFHRKYDFITATEVVEHLHHPGEELDRLWHCLKAGGRLGIMTKLALDKAAFSKWHYKNDLTHVCFFSEKTARWLAARWQAKVTFADKDVLIYDKLIKTANPS
ncbi:MAG: class I SAM-dependent methyltransferase [Deltaproteobacteria bacterium]|nr:class I SAM-dependent methyltransferase [Deltaproteobacteria bacterium]